MSYEQNIIPGLTIPNLLTKFPSDPPSKEFNLMMQAHMGLVQCMEGGDSGGRCPVPPVRTVIGNPFDSIQPHKHHVVCAASFPYVLMVQHCMSPANYPSGVLEYQDPQAPYKKGK